MKLPNIFESKATPRTFRAGDTIFASGEPAHCMYVVKAGKVDILKGGKVVETIGPDGFFGEPGSGRQQSVCQLFAEGVGDPGCGGDRQHPRAHTGQRGKGGIEGFGCGHAKGYLT